MSALRRFAVFKSLGAALAGAAGAGWVANAVQARTAQGPSRHDLRPTDPAYRFDEYEALVNREVLFRQLYQWPTIANPILFSNIRNGLNGFQFSYGAPADQIQVVVQAYFSANGATYDDYVWATYRLGEALGVRDSATGQPATRNLWYASQVPESALGKDGALPIDRTSAVYNDTSVQGLQRRGVLFLTWHQTLHTHAGSAVADGRAPGNMTEAQVADDMQAHLIPGALLIPAAVGELVRLQDKGYRLVVNG